MKTLNTKTTGADVNVQLSLEETLSHGRSQQELQSQLRLAFIVWEYIQGEVSLGEVSQLLGKEYIETMEWLNDMGVDTIRKMPPDIDDVTKQSAQSIKSSVSSKIRSKARKLPMITPEERNKGFADMGGFTPNDSKSLIEDSNPMTYYDQNTH